MRYFEKMIEYHVSEFKQDIKFVYHELSLKLKDVENALNLKSEEYAELIFSISTASNEVTNNRLIDQENMDELGKENNALRSRIEELE